MQILKNVLAGIGLICISGLFIFAMQKAPSDEAFGKEQSILNDYNVYALEMPEDLNFAGEAVPVENPDIYERMDRELLVNTYWQSNMMLLLKRVNKYFPIITLILKEEGVPDEFKYLAVLALEERILPPKPCIRPAMLFIGKMILPLKRSTGPLSL